MLFDKFCKFVETHIPHHKDTFKTTGLFVFDEKPEKILPTRFENIKELNKNFFLPFQVTAIEDPCNLFITFDYEADQIGIFCKREFVHFEKFYVNNLMVGFNNIDSVKIMDLFTNDIYSKIQYKVNINDMYMILIGNLTVISCDEISIGVNAQITMSLFISKNIIFPLTNEIFTKNYLEKYLVMGMQKLLLINSPNQFIVEESPVKTAKKINKNKIARSHQRPKYTVLKPNKIHKLFKYTPEEITENSNKKSPTPHLRRRHIRTFRSDRYINAKDKQIIIPATWIGPTEYYDGFKKYRVCLEK
jgi:hypothetical protein